MKSHIGKTLLGIAMLVIIFVVFINPQLGRISHAEHVRDRVKNLQEWHALVSAFENAQRRLPSGLYEVYQPGKGPSPRLVIECLAYSSPSAEDLQEAMHNPERFAQLVEYELLKDEHGWLVRELKACVLYPEGTFMMAQDGVVYELRRKEKLEQELAGRKSSGGRSPLRESQ